MDAMNKMWFLDKI